jgi:DNA anti-recombination protein RmuC
VDQFIPQVNEDDVERVLQRDFPVGHWQELRQMMQQVEITEKHRVILACMKNAGGDVQKLKGNLNQASGYYREIISEAEYPFYSKKMFKIDKLTDKEKADIIAKDKKQYLDWLTRAGS